MKKLTVMVLSGLISIVISGQAAADLIITTPDPPPTFVGSNFNDPLSRVVVGGANVTIGKFGVYGNAPTATDLRWVIFDHNNTSAPVYISGPTAVAGGLGFHWYDSAEIGFTLLAGHTYAMGITASTDGFQWGGEYRGPFDPVPPAIVGGGLSLPFVQDLRLGGGTLFIDNSTNRRHSFHAFTVFVQPPPTVALVDDDFLSQADVDVYNTAHGTSYELDYDAFDTIQEGVDAVVGSTVNVLPGIYTEQIHITTANLQLIGAGVDQTIIKSPADLTAFYNSGTDDNYPVVFVDGVAGVAISHLTVDGDHQGNANYRFQGIGFWNADGSVRHAKVVNVMDNPFSGAQHGVGIYAFNNTGGPYSLALEDVLVDDFQKTAVALNGAGLTVDLDQVTTIGEGSTPVTAQNGIQIGFGASGTVDACDISAVAYAGTGATASGFLGYQAGTITATGVDVDGCQTSVYWQDSNGSFADGSVTNPLGDAFYAYSTGAKSLNAPRLAAQPFAEDTSERVQRSAVSVSVSNSTFTGTNATDSWGVSAWGSGPITFNVTTCTVTNWDLGIVAYDDGGATFAMQAHQNTLAPNVSYALYSNAAQTVDAGCNWWGDLSGPSTVGFPNPDPDAEAIAGDVTFEPWLIAPAGACVGFHDNVAVVGPAGCITPDNPCRSLNVMFNRFDLTPVRATSVTLQLSSELTLCPDAGVDIAPGSFWGLFPRLQEVINNGGGSYTVDIAVLGSDCGPTTSGVLFTVNVAKAGDVTTDDVGTVTVTSVTVRDCANGTLNGGPGLPASVTIDLTQPEPITSLAATQVTTGNDTNGTTKVSLSWTATVTTDADYVEIWRKGFGNYPEYDDDPNHGAVPAGPITIANGWALVTTVEPDETGFVDEPTTRDFWYYASLVYDACGNVSAVSNMTGGTLNYHLGDVSDGTTIGTGNNTVFTEDISLLGGHYGVNDSHGLYLNYLDVGPTTDNSTNARPLTDNQIQFEDLMMFAINYYPTVSKDNLPNLTPAAESAVIAKVGEVDPATNTVRVEISMSGDGRVQALSVPLTWNGDAVQPVDYSSGGLIADQGGLGMVLSPAPGTVDAAIFGVRDQGICGTGTLAIVTFKVVGAGDPGIAVGEIVARDSENHAVVISGELAQPALVVPARTELYANTPNPFNPATELSFALSRQGNVRLQIYSVQGRLLATLVDGELPAGLHSVTWQGRDDAGRLVSSGAYIVRLEAPDATQSRRITLMK